MFTHLHPELVRDGTAASIRRESQISLWRAINIKRLVAFTGSGTSTIYGLPAWSELPQVYAKCVETQINEALEAEVEKCGHEPNKKQEQTEALRQSIRGTLDQLNKITCPEPKDDTGAPCCQTGKSEEGIKRQTDDAESGSEEEASSEDNRQKEQHIYFSKPFDGDVLTFFALCDEILDRLPDDEKKGQRRRFLARAELGQTVRAGEHKIILEKLDRLLRRNRGLSKDKSKENTWPIQGGATKNKSLPPKNQGGKVGINLTSGGASDPEDVGRFLNGGKSVLEHLIDGNLGGPESLEILVEELFQNEPPSDNQDVSFGSELEHNDQDIQRDLISTLMTDLGVSRFVTLNYDVQIERAILRAQHMSEEAETEYFRDLCEEKQTPRPHKKRLMIESGVGRGAISATLDHNNIAEVVNFAAYSKRYAQQVMHLHGRFDDPENMILTSADYVKLYEEKSVARDSFSNAQQALFDGNDVLFVGIGMSEEEINRPLKRFLASEKYGRPHSRRVFLLFQASSCEKCNPDKICKNCEISDENILLSKHNQLGVSTVLYGGPKFKFLSGQLKKCAKEFASLSGNGSRRSETYEKDLKAAYETFMNLVDSAAIRNASKVSGIRGGVNRLLTDAELDFAKEIKNFLPRDVDSLSANPHQVWSIVSGICNELLGRVMSRAACAELQNLKHNSEKWWDAWNEQPFERRAIYHMASEKVSGAKGYLWVRHSPVAGLSNKIKPDQWKVLVDAREKIKGQIKRQRRLTAKKGDKTRLAIARFTGERGRGLGTMVRMLHQKSVQEYLFARNENWEQEYSGAFIAHLSFSMEFASVSKALTRFLARRIAELQIADRNHYVSDGVISGRLKAVLGSTAPLDRGTKIEVRRLVKELAPKERLSLGGLLEKLKSDRAPGLSGKEITKLSNALYVSRRETEPRLLFDESAQTHDDLKADPEREHRLDMLEMVLKKYQSLAQGERVFICLGGLDRLCDKDGDAHNPMHRALFRLLTGTHDYVELDPPIDLLLLAGQPNSPICFLSEVLGRKAIKKLQSHEYKKYSRHSKTNLVLRKWDRLERLPWADRVATASSFFGERKFQSVFEDVDSFLNKHNPENLPDEESDARLWAAAEFIRWAMQGDASSLTVTSDVGKAVTGLHQVLWQNVGLTHMLYTCWESSVLKHKRKRPKIEKPPTILDFMAPLERRFNNDEGNGVLSGILSWYRNARPDNPEYKKGDLDPEVLHDLILRHLVLYALPIEPSVFLACPRIYRRLLQEFERKKLQSGGRTAETNEIVKRAWMFWRLRQVLGNLCGRDMLIRINCSVTPEKSADEYEEFLHHRYALHGRMREYIAHRMQLNIFDQGDTNHYQISLYCDQPKDLPTPSPLHFKMIADIINQQRDRCLETLDLTYRHSSAGRQNRLRSWDHPTVSRPEWDNENNPSRRAALRIFEPIKTKDLVDTFEKLSNNSDALFRLSGSMAEMHAVSQRIRGNFSLVRSAFSVGSLSRMDGAPEDNGDIPPFELYRGWLRSIINAATGVRVTNRELSGVFDQTLLPEILSKQKIKECEEALEGFSGSIANLEGKRREKAETILSHFGIGPMPPKQSSTPEIDGELIAAGRDALAIVKQADQLKFRKKQKSSFTHVRHPLYRDEIAWLFNERALTSLIQGRIFDAIPLFRKARNIMSHRTTPNSDSKAFNAVERRINLNFAVAKIERGRIRDARIILEDLARSSISVPYSTPSRIEPYIIGYTGLCDHLSGSFETARAAYLETLKRLSKTQDLRAISIFKRHLADLYREIGDLDLAQREVQLATNAASQAQQRDALYLTYSSRAQIDIALREAHKVEEILPQLADYAERMGLYSHRADVLMVRSRLAVAKGDLGPAADAAAGAIALCTRFGLRLRKLSGLVAYGAIQYLRDQDDIAHSILTNAKTEAEQIGYQIKASQASRLIAQKGNPTPHRVQLGPL